MDEFEDVTLKEKTFMKLWNRFLHRHAILADFQATYILNPKPQTLNPKP